MDWDTFRALETFAVLYDIEIDEERYNVGPCRLLREANQELGEARLLTVQERPDGTLRPWERWDVTPRGLDAVSADIHVLSASAGEIPGLVPGWQEGGDLGASLPQWDDIDPGWKRLLAAKRVRAELMRVNSTAADEALDRVAEDLLRTMPSEPDFLTESDSAGRILRTLDGSPHLVPQPLSDVLLRVLCLCEASQCYVGYHSIAHAEDALGLLRRTFERLRVPRPDAMGQSPYELVALFNKAMGEMHAPAYAKAAESFHGVARYAGVLTGRVPDDVFCFRRPINKSDRFLMGFRWLRAEPLYEALVGVPAVLMAAEALNKLQRSHEALKCLRVLGVSRLTPHKDLRKQVLEFRFSHDRFETQRPPALGQGLAHAKRLGGQVAACEIEYATRNLAVSDLQANLEKLGEGLQKRAHEATVDRGEFSQVLLSWTKGLSALTDPLEALLKAGRLQNGELPGIAAAVREYAMLPLPPIAAPGWGRCGDSFVDAACDLITDPVYREHRTEIREALLDGFWSLYRLAKTELNAGAAYAATTDMSRLAREAKQCVVRVCTTFEDDRVPPAEAPTRYSRHVAQCRQRVAMERSLPIGPSGRECRRGLRRFVVSEFVAAPSPSDQSTLSPPRALFSKWLAACRSFCGRPQCVPHAGAELCRTLGSAARRNPALTEVHEPNPLRPALEHYCDTVVGINNESIKKRLHGQGDKPPRTPSRLGLAILQRWNSFTPAMASSEGGGYLITWASDDGEGAPDREGCGGGSEETARVAAPASRSFGVAVDPGYGFVKNLLSEGYNIGTVTDVVVTHDHPDHLADFEALHNLLFEYNADLGANAGGPHRVNLALSRGALDHLQPVIDSSDVIKNTIVLEPGDSPTRAFPAGSVQLREGPPCAITITAVVALHRDVSTSTHRRDSRDSIGLIAELMLRGDCVRIGLPSDTAWSEEIAEEYCQCDVVCLHLGSVSKRGHTILGLLNNDELDLVLDNANHLYLPGVLWFISRLSRQKGLGGSAAETRERPLVVLSELGEELSGGMRILLARALDRWSDGARVVPGDVGLLIDPLDRAIRCSCCQRYYCWDDTEFFYEQFGDSEQIFYVCPSCNGALGYDQRAAIFRRRQMPLLRRPVDNAQ